MLKCAICDKIVLDDNYKYTPCKHITNDPKAAGVFMGINDLFNIITKETTEENYTIVDYINEILNSKPTSTL